MSSPGPRSTVIMPVSVEVARFSPDAPTTRSAYPSLFVSPQALSAPKPSPASDAPGTPGLSCVRTRVAAATGPSVPPGTTETEPAPPETDGVPATRSSMPSWSKSAVAAAEFTALLEAKRRISGSLAYRLSPGHSVANPSRWPETVLSVAWSPVFHTPVSPAAVSVTLPDGFPPYWPSFHPATRETACRAAAVGLPAPGWKSPRTAMPTESLLKP